MPTVLILTVIATALFVAGATWKLVEGWREASDQDMLTELDGELQELQLLAVTKSRMLSDIKDLEFDHQTGHVSPEDYADLRRRMESRAIHVLKRLDALRGDVDFDQKIDDGYEERFGVRKKKKKKKARKMKPAAKPMPVSAGGFCPECGAPNHKNAKFCSTCGFALAEVVVDKAGVDEEAQQ
jgi:hypothetical protein